MVHLLPLHPEIPKSVPSQPQHWCQK